MLALADALIGYSKYVNNIQLIMPLVEHVANKHVSVEVTKDQYNVVGEVLLAALEVNR